MRTRTPTVSGLVTVLLAVAALARVNSQGEATTFKVAYYNIQSGMGTAALVGACSFQRNSNCTDPSQPMNAWGVGVVQGELNRALNGDPTILALGLAEAWPCASPAAVLNALGWAAHTGERNGVSLLARHGFAGAAEWFQLDTSLNSNPNDTKWIVRAPVCADAACSRSVEIFSAHWYASGDTRTESFERQAHQTVEFMDRLPATEPRVLVGDLNVWDEEGVVCNQTPVPSAMQILRDAGNVDAWRSVNGTAEGYTGMWNRNGCGDPNGYLWKRIDQAWSKALAPPVSMTRFGMVTPGECAPSDHAGIVVEYPWPGGEDGNAPPVASFTESCVDLECSFTDTSSDADGALTGWSWTFGDGAASTGQHPNHHYAAAGTYTVSLTVTDGLGATSTATRSVTVSAAAEPFDFTVSASPPARRVKAGAKASYKVSTSPISGSAGDVILGVSGLPAGVTAVFDPPSITTSGSSTLSIATAKSTGAGSYALTISSSGGGLLRSVQVTLEVVRR